MEEVNLYTAFGWMCPKCEAQNYCDGVMYEMTDEERADFNEELEEMGEDTEGDWISLPNAVKCKSCSTKFKVAQDIEDDRSGS